MYLPPATAAQAHAVYALLRVTPAEIRLERIYDGIYFISTLAHLIVRLLFLAVGASVAFRSCSDSLAQRLLDFGFGKRLAVATKRLAQSCWASDLSKSKFGVALSAVAAAWQPKLLRSAFIYYFLYTLCFTIFWSPLSYYADFTLPHRYGLSHETIRQWLSDSLKDTAVGALMGSIFAAAAVWGIAVFPKRWAIIFAWCAVPIIFLSIFLDPLFDRIDNHFTPLSKSSPLYAPLHRLADEAGVPQAQILVADKSKQTDETNAYVTGLGSSAQIVLWDTTIKRMKPDEIVAITGHEFGHYVEHHVVFGGAAGAAALFLFLPGVKLLAELILKWGGKRWKIESLADPAALPILIVSLSILTFLTSPITNFASRVIEHRADSFGLTLTRNRVAMATALVDLANENMSDPYPPAWEVFWLDNHPPLGERIHFVLYDQPLKPFARLPYNKP